MSTAQVAVLISLASFLVAATSLGWQVLAFKKTGYRVKCVLEMGFIGEDQLESGGTVTSMVSASPKRWAETAMLRETPEQHFFVTVTNVGRAAVWVDSMGLTAKDGVVTVSTDSGRPALP